MKRKHKKKCKPARGTLPQTWFFENERDAVAFYGDALTALLFEAMPGTAMFNAFMESLSRHDSVMDALGMSADFIAACTLTRLPLEAIDDIVDTNDFLGRYQRMHRIFRYDDAVVLCKSLNWPLAAFYRASWTAWHPGTLRDTSLHNNFEEPPF